MSKLISFHPKDDNEVFFERWGSDRLYVNVGGRGSLLHSCQVEYLKDWFAGCNRTERERFVDQETGA
jgi:hypothetical protein